MRIQWGRPMTIIVKIFFYLLILGFVGLSLENWLKYKNKYSYDISYKITYELIHNIVFSLVVHF